MPDIIKITDLPEETDPALEDLFMIVHDPDGIPTMKKVKAQNLPIAGPVGPEGPEGPPTTVPIAESDVTGLVADLAAKAPLASPALTGAPTAPTAANATSTTQVATTAFVHNVAPTLPIAESDVTGLVADLAAKATLPIAESDVTGLVADLATKAPLASPALTGTPTVPTASVGTNTTQAASTAFVLANSGGGVTLPIAESDVTNLVTDLAAKAPLASPALTGVPTVPTASVGTNTTQAASTAFVLANAGGAGTVTHTVGALTANKMVVGNGAADVKVADAAVSFPVQVGSALYDTGNSGAAKSIDWDNGNVQFSTLTGNCAFTLTHPVSGFRYSLIIDPGAGGFTPTFSPTLAWLDAVPAFPVVAGKLYEIIFQYVGPASKYLAAFTKEI